MAKVINTSDFTVNPTIDNYSIVSMSRAVGVVESANEVSLMKVAVKIKSNSVQDFLLSGCPVVKTASGIDVIEVDLPTTDKTREELYFLERIPADLLRQVKNIATGHIYSKYDKDDVCTAYRIPQFVAVSMLAGEDLDKEDDFAFADDYLSVVKFEDGTTYSKMGKVVRGGKQGEIVVVQFLI